ncbi:hypothetical protein DFJ77DRAFT_359838 [Powellomyces hirtus]|nr:hypothetical protein DFJ77DRAFT_359838 [Powellomyces hirtus]
MQRWVTWCRVCSSSSVSLAGTALSTSVTVLSPRPCLQMVPPSVFYWSLFAFPSIFLPTITYHLRDFIPATVRAAIAPEETIVFFEVYGRKLDNGVEVLRLHHAAGKPVLVADLRDRIAEETNTYKWRITVHQYNTPTSLTGTTTLPNPLRLEEPLPKSDRNSPFILRFNSLSDEEKATSAAFTRTSPAGAEPLPTATPRTPASAAPSQRTPTIAEPSQRLKTLESQCKTSASVGEYLREFLVEVRAAGEWRTGVIFGSFEIVTYQHGSHSTWTVGTRVEFKDSHGNVHGGLVFVVDTELDFIVIIASTELEPPPFVLAERGLRVRSLAYIGDRLDQRDGTIASGDVRGRFFATPGVDLGHSGGGVFAGTRLCGMVVGARRIAAGEFGNTALLTTRFADYRTKPLWEPEEPGVSLLWH